MNGFLIGLLASLVVALLYGLFFAQREDRIRLYLRVSSRGLVRLWYVAAFVGAVRGRAVAGDTGLLGYLILLVPFILSFWLSASARNIESNFARLDVDLKRVEEASGTPRSTPVPTLESLRREVEELKTESRTFLSGVKAASWLSFGAFYVGLLIWRPFIVMRRRFAYELDRFTLRIQGLASKTELAELAVLESRVCDEKSLRSFVRAARGIAARHNVSEMVATFDLWMEDSEL